MAATADRWPGPVLSDQALSMAAAESTKMVYWRSLRCLQSQDICVVSHHYSAQKITVSCSHIAYRNRGPWKSSHPRHIQDCRGSRRSHLDRPLGPAWVGAGAPLGSRQEALDAELTTVRMVLGSLVVRQTKRRDFTIFTDSQTVMTCIQDSRPGRAKPQPSAALS